MIKAGILAATSLTLLGACATAPARPGADPYAAELRELERAPLGPIARNAPDPEAAPAPIDPAERAPSDYADARAVLATRDARGRTEERVIVRRGDRLHVTLSGAGGSAEWLFVRNPLDGARFTGWRIDHRIRHAIRYDWAALRAGGVADSWMRLACMGVRPSDLPAPRADAPVREAFGLAFTLLEPSLPGVRAVWWNAEHAIALAIEGGEAGAEWAQELVALELSADPALLADVETRFPGYAVRDLADYQDYAHVHADAGDHAH